MWLMNMITDIWRHPRHLFGVHVELLILSIDRPQLCSHHSGKPLNSTKPLPTRDGNGAGSVLGKPKPNPIAISTVPYPSPLVVGFYDCHTKPFFQICEKVHVKEDL